MFRFLARLVILLTFAILAAPFLAFVLDNLWTFVTTGDIPQFQDISSKAFIIRAIFAIPLMFHFLATAIFEPRRKYTEKADDRHPSNNIDIEKVLTDLRQCVSEWNGASHSALELFGDETKKSAELLKMLQTYRATYVEDVREAFVLPELWEAQEAAKEERADALEIFVDEWHPRPDDYKQEDIDDWRRLLKAALIGERAKIAYQMRKKAPVVSEVQANAGPGGASSGVSSGGRGAGVGVSGGGAGIGGGMTAGVIAAGGGASGGLVSAGGGSGTGSPPARVVAEYPVANPSSAPQDKPPSPWKFNSTSSVIQ